MQYTYSTEVGLLAIWDSTSFFNIDTIDKYRAIFTSDKEMLALMNAGKAIIWSTGGDGDFFIDIRINPDQELTEEENELVEMKALNLKLTVTNSTIFIGTPEAAGVEPRGLEEKLLTKIDDLTNGNYLVNIYFLYEDTEDVQSDRTGLVVTMKKVEDDYNFPLVTDLPELG